MTRKAPGGTPMKTRALRWLVLLTGMLVLVPILGLGARAAAQDAQTPLGQPSLEGFVGVDTLEGVEQIPAVPLVLTAYAIVWVAVLAYVWLTWRRLGKVEADLERLARLQRPE